MAGAAEKWVKRGGYAGWLAVMINQWQSVRNKIHSFIRTGSDADGMFSAAAAAFYYCLVNDAVDDVDVEGLSKRASVAHVCDALLEVTKFMGGL